MTSAPICSTASSNQIALPQLLCIGAAGLVVELLVGEHRAGTARAVQHDAHEELRVEPEPDLLAHLRDPVGREPAAPSTRGRAGRRRSGRRRRRPRSRPRRALVAASRASRTGRCRRRASSRRPRARARRVAPHVGAAISIGVDPGPVQLLEPVDRRRRARSRSSAREPITVRSPDGADVERQRQAPVALARDAPVAHVAQPVLHALAVVLAASTRTVCARVDHRLRARRRREMNHSSTTRKISSVPQRQQTG